ncbi:MAG: lactate utilization protein [Treponema sp.]|jgi:hypothetical protein|nr:lactate utilization protein [Treponema sp.]
MDSPNRPFVELRNSKLGPVLVKALQARHFDAEYFDDIPQAVEKVFSLIPGDHVISWGGSMTAAAMDLYNEAAKRDYKLINRDTAKTQDEKMEMMRQALLCDTYLMGANAISEDGQLVNIDAYGNRAAALCFGPRQVIVIAGMNKVRKTLDIAIARARTIAAPLNIQRFAANKTPCNISGACEDCKSPDSICSHMVITRLCKPAGRIKVILVGKDLGF